MNPKLVFAALAKKYPKNFDCSSGFVMDLFRKAFKEASLEKIASRCNLEYVRDTLRVPWMCNKAAFMLWFEELSTFMKGFEIK